MSFLWWYKFKYSVHWLIIITTHQFCHSQNGTTTMPPCSPVYLLLNILISLHQLCSNTAFYMAKCTNYLPFTLLSNASIWPDSQDSCPIWNFNSNQIIFPFNGFTFNFQNASIFSFLCGLCDVLHKQITYIHTYLLTYLLHAAQFFLRC